MQVKPADEDVQALMDVADAALRWWRDHRPLKRRKGWHIQNATVNTTTDIERRLAEAVAELSKRGWTCP
jgi:hypothetical protein